MRCSNRNASLYFIKLLTKANLRKSYHFTYFLPVKQFKALNTTRRFALICCLPTPKANLRKSHHFTCNLSVKQSKALNSTRGFALICCLPTPKANLRKSNHSSYSLSAKQYKALNSTCGFALICCLPTPKPPSPCSLYSLRLIRGLSKLLAICNS